MTVLVSAADTAGSQLGMTTEGSVDPRLALLEGQEAGDLLTQQGKTALQQAVQDLLGQQLKELNEPGEIKGVFFTEFVMQ